MAAFFCLIVPPQNYMLLDDPTRRTGTARGFRVLTSLAYINTNICGQPAGGIEAGKHTAAAAAAAPSAYK